MKRTKTMVRIRRTLATAALSLSLLIVPGTAFASPLEVGSPVVDERARLGAICKTSPQINNFEPACSGNYQPNPQGYFEVTSETAQPDASSSNDYTLWIASGLLGALAVGIAGIAVLASHRHARAHA